MLWSGLPSARSLLRPRRGFAGPRGLPCPAGRRDRFGRAAFWLGPLLGFFIGCDEPTADLRSSVELLAAEHGEVAERAWERIERHRRTALPYLEAALHRVAPPGRRNIVLALRRLALPESAALVGHVAAFDADPQVRSEAYRTLESWAAAPPPISAAARAALWQVDEVRSGP